MNKPVILVVDDDPQVLAAVRRDLRSQYRERCTVLGASSGPEALDTVRELKSRGDALALVVSDQRMPGMAGTDVLLAVRDIHPHARRVLLTAYSDMGATITAINVAHIHHYLQKPWDPPDERLFPVVDELLDDWQAEYLPEEKGLRLVGDQWSARSHAIKNYLACNVIPYRWLDVTRDTAARALLEAAGVSDGELPALVFEDGSVLKNPEPREVAERLNRPLTAQHSLYDLVIVGAGPAGLAGAVYGASEGLKTLLLDAYAPGGQAGTSSRIENYLGFPNGVSGSELTRRALAQAERLGAEFLAPVCVNSASTDGGYVRLALSDGRQLVSRSLLAATGMHYREHPARGMREHLGAGVYYGAAVTEGPAFAGRRVVVVGGGNSAGQGALYLSRHASEVQIVIRRESLTETMSHYLVKRIGEAPNIRLRPMTEVEFVEGNGHVERVGLKATDTGAVSVEDADAVFVFIGTRPRSEWLPERVLRDEKGFVLIGLELSGSADFPRAWKERRDPLPLETSVPGIFAAGDVCAGVMNRVASAVGAGSMVATSVHKYLSLT